MLRFNFCIDSTLPTILAHADNSYQTRKAGHGSSYKWSYNPCNMAENKWLAGMKSTYLLGCPWKLVTSS